MGDLGAGEDAATDSATEDSVGKSLEGDDGDEGAGAEDDGVGDCAEEGNEGCEDESDIA